MVTFSRYYLLIRNLHIWALKYGSRWFLSGSFWAFCSLPCLKAVEPSEVTLHSCRDVNLDATSSGFEVRRDPISRPQMTAPPCYRADRPRQKCGLHLGGREPRLEIWPDSLDPSSARGWKMCPANHYPLLKSMAAELRQVGRSSTSLCVWKGVVSVKTRVEVASFFLFLMLDMNAKFSLSAIKLT